MFDRMTDESKEAMNLTREAAQASGSNYLDDVHLLIGCCRARDSLAAKVLRACAIDSYLVWTEAARRAAAPARAAPEPDQFRFTESAKKALERAMEEASRFEHTSLGTHHVLLGLLRNASPNAAALGATGLSLDDARRVACEIQASIEPVHRPPLGKGFRSQIGVLRGAQQAFIELHEFELASRLRDLVHKLEFPPRPQ